MNSILYIKIVKKCIDEINEAKSRFLPQDNYFGVISGDNVDLRKFLELDYRDKAFILNSLLKGANIPETLRFIDGYYKMKDSNNFIIIRSDKFREKERKIEDLKRLLVDNYNKVTEAYRSLTEKVLFYENIMDILRSDITDSKVDFNTDELLVYINNLGINDQEKIDLLLLIFEKLTIYFNEKISEKNKENVKQLEDNKNILYKKVVENNKKTNKEPTIKTKTVNLIKEVINIPEIKENLEKSGLLIADLDLILYDFLIEESANITDIKKEDIIEFVNRYIIKELELKKYDEYRRFIQGNNNVIPFINIFLEKTSVIDFIEICCKENIELSENAIKDKLKELYIKELETEKNNIYLNIDLGKVLLTGNSEKLASFNVNQELLNKIKSNFEAYGIDFDKLADLKDIIEKKDSFIRANLDLLLKDSSELSDEEFEKYKTISNYIDVTKKIYRETYSTEKIKENINDDLFVLEFYEMLELAKGYEGNKQQVENIEIEDDIKNPFTHILFLDEGIIEQINELPSNYQGEVGKQLKKLNEKSIQEAGILTTKYHSRDGNEYHKHLKQNDITETKTPNTRIFVREIAKQDGGYRYVIVYIEKKISRGADESINAKNASNSIRGKEGIIKDLAEKAFNDEKLKVELENQKILAFQIGEMLDIKRMG